MAEQQFRLDLSKSSTLIQSNSHEGNKKLMFQITFTFKQDLGRLFSGRKRRSFPPVEDVLGKRDRVILFTSIYFAVAVVLGVAE